MTFISKQLGLSRVIVYNWLCESMANGSFDNTLGAPVLVEGGANAFTTYTIITPQNALEAKFETATEGTAGIHFGLPFTLLPQPLSAQEPCASQEREANKKEMPPAIEPERPKEAPKKTVAENNVEIAGEPAGEKFDPSEYQGKSEEELIAAIRDLKRQLEDRTFEARAYETMIEVSEDTLKIDIRKKPGARQ